MARFSVRNKCVERWKKVFCFSLWQLKQVSSTVSLANIAIHAVMMAVLVWTAHRASLVTRDIHARVRLVIVMWATVTVLMYAHLC